MKTITKVSLSIVAITVGTVFFTNGIPQASSSSGGAPAGYTGSPADGSNCTSCHSGAATIQQAGMITSTIPGTGYVPGSIYTITGTVTNPWSSKFGFEISPQSLAGTALGTMVVTTVGTQNIGTKYITHSPTGTSGSATKSWSFDWIAPTAGTGAVTFYGAFNATNSNNNPQGDTIYNSTLTVQEQLTNGIENIRFSENTSIYPNPVTDKVYIVNTANANENILVSIIDMNGRLIKQTEKPTLNSFINMEDLAIGSYVMKIETSNGTAIKKFIKK